MKNAPLIASPGFILSEKTGPKNRDAEFVRAFVLAAVLIFDWPDVHLDTGPIVLRGARVKALKLSYAILQR